MSEFRDKKINRRQLLIRGSKAGAAIAAVSAGAYLLYDDKGALKKKFETDWGSFQLGTGMHTIRVSCSFNPGSDLILHGVLKLKDKIGILGH